MDLQLKDKIACFTGHFFTLAPVVRGEVQPEQCEGWGEGSSSELVPNLPHLIYSKVPNEQRDR
jgi:hypothetical protein